VTEQAHQIILDELADIARVIEAHLTAVWLLERQRDEVRERLIASGWKPPELAP
jgi:hypothetical protein